MPRVVCPNSTNQAKVSSRSQESPCSEISHNPSHNHFYGVSYLGSCLCLSLHVGCPATIASLLQKLKDLTSYFNNHMCKSLVCKDN